MATDVVLEATGLHAYYDASHILRGIDLTIRESEAVCLVGRNGMGKTTTLRTLLGLVRPREGSVHILGRDMTRAAPHRIAAVGIALVPEGRGIFPRLSVHENLVMAARPRKDGGTNWTLDAVLALFPRIRERLRNMGWQLSGGEQQMLAIGRALMTNPSLLLLDEATEGLAPRVRSEIWSALAELKRQKVATLVVDKDIQALARIVDRCLVLSKGRFVYSGAPGPLIGDRDLLARHLAV